MQRVDGSGIGSREEYIRARERDQPLAFECLRVSLPLGGMRSGPKGEGRERGRWAASSNVITALPQKARQPEITGCCGKLRFF
jgi:hypothetical protein